MIKDSVAVVRLRKVEADLTLERHRRLLAEQRAAGLTSAVRRLSDLLQKQKEAARPRVPIDC